MPFMVGVEVAAEFGIPSGVVTASVEGDTSLYSAWGYGGNGNCWLTIV